AGAAPAGGGLPREVLRMGQQPKRFDGVFEGGGVKGIGLVGALAAIEKAGYEAVNVAGTSAGAIVASLYAAGYTAAELKPIIMGLDFNQLTDPRPSGICRSSVP